MTSESPPTPGPTEDAGLADSLLRSPRTHNLTSTKSSWQVDALVAKEFPSPPSSHKLTVPAQQQSLPSCPAFHPASPDVWLSVCTKFRAGRVQPCYVRRSTFLQFWLVTLNLQNYPLTLSCALSSTNESLEGMLSLNSNFPQPSLIVLVPFPFDA